MPPTSQESNSSLRWRPHSVHGAGGTHVASIARRHRRKCLQHCDPCAGDGDSGADVVANSRREGHSAATAAIDHRHDCDCTSPFTDGPPIDAVVIPFFLRAAVGWNWRLTSPVGARRRNASHVILLRTAAFATRLNAKSVGRFRN
jgi:hypothetical protein